VDAYLTKDATAATLFAALRGVLRGERRRFSPAVVGRLAQLRHAQTFGGGRQLPADRT
jgi:DNA-binding NarL/FixJ family response regulator